MAEFAKSLAELKGTTIAIEVRLDTLVRDAILRHQEVQQFRERRERLAENDPEHAKDLLRREQKALTHVLRICMVLDKNQPRVDMSWFFFTERCSAMPLEELFAPDEFEGFKLKVEPVINSSGDGMADRVVID